MAAPNLLQLSPPTCDDRLIWDVERSFYHFPTLAAADELGLFPLLDTNPMTAAQVGQALSLGPRATEALLGVLTSLGFLTQSHGHFSLSGVSRTYLLPGSPYYRGSIIKLFGNVPLTSATILEALKKERASAYGGGEMWETHEMDSALAEGFTHAMHCQSLPLAMGVALNGDFHGIKRVLDVGGGSGCFCIVVAQRWPGTTFTIMELPAVSKVAQRYIAEHGLQDRINTVELDMFKDRWPREYDGVFFSNVFHDWDRDRCLFLSRRAFEALPSGGRIFVNEMLLDETKDRPLAATSFSMTMMVYTQGKQYSANELREILGESGFEDIRVTPTHCYYSLVTARKR
ncbi:MAG: ubiquinone/menaquinone biosynthesis protein [Acidobacteria bacterium]|nr:MAG: ubiquinone/menaquinone biosynthesis protein [Acidobacteriota bacterium]